MKCPLNQKDDTMTTTKITLVSRYDHKEATVRASNSASGETCYISPRQIREASVRAGLVSGDYFIDILDQDGRDASDVVRIGA